MLDSKRLEEISTPSWEAYIGQLVATHGDRPIKLQSPRSLGVAQEAVNKAFLAAIKKIRIHLIRVIEIITKHEPSNYQVYQALLDKTNNDVVLRISGKMRLAVQEQTATDSISQNLLAEVLNLLYQIPYTAIRDHQTLNQNFIDLIQAIIQLEKFIKEQRPFSLTKRVASPLKRPLVAGPVPAVAAVGSYGEVTLSAPQVANSSFSVSPRGAIAGVLLLSVVSGVIALSDRNQNTSTITLPHSDIDTSSSQPINRNIADAAPDHGIYAHALTTSTFQIPGHNSVFKPTLINFFATQPQLARTCIPTPFANITQLVDRLDDAPPISKSRLHALARNAHTNNVPFTIMWTADCKQFRFVAGNAVLQRTIGAIAGEIVITLNQ